MNCAVAIEAVWLRPMSEFPHDAADSAVIVYHEINGDLEENTLPGAALSPRAAGWMYRTEAESK